MRRLAVLALTVILAGSALAAQFGSSQYPIRADDGDEITNFTLSAELTANLAKLPAQVPVGNLAGDVTLLQFYDLNCPYCREAAADVDTLLKSDKKLKLVFVPYAVLSVQSVQGGLVELAAARQLTPDKFLSLHRRIYAGGRGLIDASRVASAAQSEGLDPRTLVDAANSPATFAALKQNADFGSVAKLVVTPAYVINGVALLGHPGAQAAAKNRRGGARLRQGDVLKSQRWGRRF
jgi:protein-disulfide isomerase